MSQGQWSETIYRQQWEMEVGTVGAAIENMGSIYVWSVIDSSIDPTLSRVIATGEAPDLARAKMQAEYALTSTPSSQVAGSRQHLGYTLADAMLGIPPKRAKRRQAAEGGTVIMEPDGTARVTAPTPAYSEERDLMLGGAPFGTIEVPPGRYPADLTQDNYGAALHLEVNGVPVWIDMDKHGYWSEPDWAGTEARRRQALLLDPEPETASAAVTTSGYYVVHRHSIVSGPYATVSEGMAVADQGPGHVEWVEANSTPNETRSFPPDEFVLEPTRPMIPVEPSVTREPPEGEPARPATLSPSARW